MSDNQLFNAVSTAMLEGNLVKRHRLIYNTIQLVHMSTSIHRGLLLGILANMLDTGKDHETKTPDSLYNSHELTVDAVADALAAIDSQYQDALVLRAMCLVYTFKPPNMQMLIGILSDIGIQKGRVKI